MRLMKVQAGTPMTEVIKQCAAYLESARPSAAFWWAASPEGGQAARRAGRAHGDAAAALRHRRRRRRGDCRASVPSMSWAEVLKKTRTAARVDVLAIRAQPAARALRAVRVYCERAAPLGQSFCGPQSSRLPEHLESAKTSPRSGIKQLRDRGRLQNRSRSRAAYSHSCSARAQTRVLGHMPRGGPHYSTRGRPHSKAMGDTARPRAPERRRHPR